MSNCGKDTNSNLIKKYEIKSYTKYEFKSYKKHIQNQALLMSPKAEKREKGIKKYRAEYLHAEVE